MAAAIQSDIAPQTRGTSRRGSSIWLATLLCLPAVLPLIVIAFALISPEVEVWSHLSRYVLPEVLVNTLKLVVGVAIVAGALGTFLAWLVSMCEFPGRRYFEWILLLPLAIPAYVLAFVAVASLDYAGSVTTFMRGAFGSSNWIPPIRSTGGVIAVMSLALYPYVYLLARGAFLTQGRRALEAAQSLGYSRSSATWKVALPMARPWIAAGVALVCMETLADFGAVSVFNYNTFTTAIYRAWFGMFSVNAALELSGLLLIFVFLALAIDRRSRMGVRFTSSRDMSRESPRVQLGGMGRVGAIVFVSTIVALAFVLPVMQLIWWAIKRASRDLDVRYWEFIAHSLVLASSAVVVILASSLALAYLGRRSNTNFVRALIRLATMGYAMPGTVLAVGILVPLVLLNNALQDALRSVLGTSAPMLLLQSTLIAVLLAYMARFLAVGFNPIESGLQRVTNNLDEAAIGMGVNGLALVRKVHVPLLRTSLASAATLVFVDVMKEMPITLITRPFGWDTLAVRVFNMTSIGEWERAALPAIAIVAVGLIPVAMLTRRGTHVA